jgi:tRNA(Ile)-lysidine synthase
LRNKIRHDLVPLFKALNLKFIASFQKHSLSAESQQMVEDASIMVYQQVAKQEDEIRFDLNQLKNCPITGHICISLNQFGFLAWEDIYDLVDSQSGKQVFRLTFVY